MSEENTTPAEQDQQPEALPWREQPRKMKNLLIGIAALVGGIVWAVLEHNSDSRWVLWGFIPVSWFFIGAGAIAFAGEAIKKPKK